MPVEVQDLHRRHQQGLDNLGHLKRALDLGIAFLERPP